MLTCTTGTCCVEVCNQQHSCLNTEQQSLQVAPSHAETTSFPEQDTGNLIKLHTCLYNRQLVATATKINYGTCAHNVTASLLNIGLAAASAKVTTAIRLAVQSRHFDAFKCLETLDINGARNTNCLVSTTIPFFPYPDINMAFQSNRSTNV